MTAENLVNILSAFKFSVQDEKETQNQIQNILEQHDIQFRREWKIGIGDIPDFFTGSGIVIEVKIKGRATDILKQCLRYSLYDAAKAIILVTNKLHGMPSELNKRPVYVINIGKAWL